MQTRTLERSPIFLHQLLNTIYARQIQTCPKKENIYLMLTHQLLNYTDRKNILIYSIYNNIYTSISCRDKVFFVLKRIPAWSIKKKSQYQRNLNMINDVRGGKVKKKLSSETWDPTDEQSRSYSFIYFFNLIQYSPFYVSFSNVAPFSLMLQNKLIQLLLTMEWPSLLTSQEL